MRKLFILGILILFIPVVLFADFTDAQIEYAFAQKMQLDTIRILEADENNRVVIEELHFQDLLPTMNEYTRGYYADFNRQLSALRLVEVQRDRLNYLYERKQETLINSLMPNAISIATIAFSTRSLLSSVIAIAGTALSSINSYATQEDVIELEYIQQDWELDDQETLALDALATNLYLYKCDIGASLGIDRTQALSSDDLKSFVRACNESSPAVRYSRLSRLESRLGTLPDYWREMAKAASDKGLKLLGITEHSSGIPGSCDPIYFRNLHVVPRQMYGIELLLGAEINILDTAGHLDMDEFYLQKLDLRIAGIHSLCYQQGTVEENTQGLEKVICNPYIHIISHPGDGTAKLQFEPLVLAAKEHHTLLEINNSSLKPCRGKLEARGNNLEILRLCKQYEVPVILGSDAHISFDIADYDLALELVAETEFPESLIMNTSVTNFKTYLNIG